MSCTTNNATPPGPAIAPGVEDIDVRRYAAALGEQGMVDPRIPALVPGFDAPFFQAGLAGYSDAAMRIIARRHGCPFCVTEALLDRTLLAGGRGFDKADLGELHDNIPGGVEDHPLAGQIMGSEPAEMAAAALKMVEQRRRTDRDYRRLAYSGALAPGSPLPRVPERQHLRLPGGQQLGPYDPTEGLDDLDGAADSCDPLDHLDADASELDLLDGGPGPLEGASPESLSALRPQPAGDRSFEVIDVNLACPVKKIERKARGGHWLAEPEGAIKILEAVRAALPPEIPCTVKLRRSFDDTPEMAENFERIFAAAYDMGYAWATVHARTVEQKYVGPSRWTFLRDLRQRHPDKIIFGSGDVWEVHDIFRMLAYTGVSGVSVARGCIGNPWIFAQARQLLAGQSSTSPPLSPLSPPSPPSPLPHPLAPTIAEQREVLRQHFELSLAVTRRFRHGEGATSRMMRKFGIRFSAHHPRGDEVRRRFIAVSSTADWRAVLDEFY